MEEMSTAKRLSIGQIQIYFDQQGAALFLDGQKRDRVAVETSLTESRDFIDRWLEASEETRPRHITKEERELRANLRHLARDLSRTFPKDFVNMMVQEVAKLLGERSPNLSQARLAGSVEDVIFTL